MEPRVISSIFSLDGFSNRIKVDGCEFCFCDSVTDADFLAHRILDGPLNSDRIFKQERRRNVFALGNRLVKKYVFEKLTDILHSKRYAPVEFADFCHYVSVSKPAEGIRIPQLLGYFSLRKMWFWYSINGLVMEYIPNTRFLKQTEYALAAKLFVNHYRSGIYHPDMQYQNILIQEDTNILYPIDYIGCNFLDSPNLETLLLQLGRYCKTARWDDESSRALLKASLEQLPEVTVKTERAWEVLKILMGMNLRTHQHNNILMLSTELRKKLTGNK